MNTLMVQSKLVLIEINAWASRETFFLRKSSIVNISMTLFVVKLQAKLNNPVQVRQGVDFVFPLSQEQEQQEQQEPPPKSTRTKCTTDLEFGT